MIFYLLREVCSKEGASFASFYFLGPKTGFFLSKKVASFHQLPTF